MNSHDKIAGMLTVQLRTVLDNLPPEDCKDHATKTPTMRLLESRTFSTQLESCADADAVAIAIQSNPEGAHCF